MIKAWKNKSVAFHFPYDYFFDTQYIYKIEREVFMSDTNTPPLSQNEIDALITFLNNNRETYSLRGDTLSQESVNKLIELVKSIPSLDKNISLNPSAMNTSSFFSNKDNTKDYKLNFKTGEDGQINIFAYNSETKDIVAILPKMLSKVDTAGLPETWGICMSPNAFHHIAKLLDLDYTDETLNELAALFTEKMYGRTDVVLPAFYLP